MNQSRLDRPQRHSFVVFRKPVLDEELDISDLPVPNQTLLQDVDPVDDEISVAKAPALARTHRGNAPELFAAGFCGSLLCLLGPLFYREWKTAKEAQPETGSVFGLPVIARLASKKVASADPEKASEALGLAALKVATRMDFPKGVITIAFDGHNVALIDAMAKKLRHDGARVVVARASDLVQSIEDALIDDNEKTKSAGRVRLRRMKDQTDCVLVSTTLFDDPFELESAACFSDGVVLVVPKHVIRSPKTQKVISELDNLPTRLLGVVVE
jgi:hypothetical protein